MGIWYIEKLSTGTERIYKFQSKDQPWVPWFTKLQSTQQCSIFLWNWKNRNLSSFTVNELGLHVHYLHGPPGGCGPQGFFTFFFLLFFFLLFEPITNACFYLHVFEIFLSAIIRQTFALSPYSLLIQSIFPSFLTIQITFGLYISEA